MAEGGTVLVIEEATTTCPPPGGDAGHEEDQPDCSRPSTTDDCRSPGTSPKMVYDRLDLEEDSRFRNWKQGESLGRGAYGEVFRAMVAGRFMAVKKIPLDLSLNIKAAEKEINSLLLEINTLKRLKHPRIVRYHGCVRQDSEEDPALLIFLEYMPSGSIKGVLTKFGPYGVGLVRKYTRQICEGLHFLHSEKIVHRDVKGANILIDTQGDAKLADFGACRELEALQSTVTNGLKSIHGSVYWMAPEVMKFKAGRRSDIWSMGCTVIEMITAEPPWPNLRVDKLTVTETLRRIVDSEETPPLPEKIHHHCAAFLQQTLIRDYNQRPYTDKLLMHIFLQDAGASASSVPKGAQEAWGSLPPSVSPSPELS
uniref:Protein kinase domain-containing protein n=1 Tax=Alexandrium monilatum TaxID=311494 RepID=A0A7S4RQ68_9DINO